MTLGKTDTYEVLSYIPWNFRLGRFAHCNNVKDGIVLMADGIIFEVWTHIGFGFCVQADSNMMTTTKAEFDKEGRLWFKETTGLDDLVREAEELKKKITLLQTSGKLEGEEITDEEIENVVNNLSKIPPPPKKH